MWFGFFAVVWWPLSIGHGPTRGEENGGAFGLRPDITVTLIPRNWLCHFLGCGHLAIQTLDLLLWMGGWKDGGLIELHFSCGFPRLSPFFHVAGEEKLHSHVL